MAPPQPLGEFEQLVLLAILQLGPEAYGVGIGRKLEREAGRVVSRGALYTTLDRLEDKGLVRWKLAAGDASRDRLPRRILRADQPGPGGDSSGPACGAAVVARPRRRPERPGLVPLITCAPRRLVSRADSWPWPCRPACAATRSAAIWPKSFRIAPLGCRPAAPRSGTGARRSPSRWPSRESGSVVAACRPRSRCRGLRSWMRFSRMCGTARARSSRRSASRPPRS